MKYCNPLTRSLTLIGVCLLIISSSFTPIQLQSINKQHQLPFKNLMDWWKYHSINIKFHLDYQAVDQHNKIIAKTAFLDSLATGNFIPIKKTKNTSAAKNIYYLFVLKDPLKKQVSPTIMNQAKKEIAHLKMEGKDFPNFSVTAVNNKKFDNASLANKIVFIKTYFIACVACNNEMPRLNAFFGKRTIKKNQELYLCLALDAKNELISFLKSHESYYEYIPDQQTFIDKFLKSNSYPTHFLVQNGKITKVFNQGKDLIEYVNLKGI